MSGRQSCRLRVEQVMYIVVYRSMPRMRSTKASVEMRDLKDSTQSVVLVG